MTERLNWTDSICYLNVTEKTNERLSVTFKLRAHTWPTLSCGLVCSFCLWIFFLIIII